MIYCKTRIFYMLWLICSPFYFICSFILSFCYVSMYPSLFFYTFYESGSHHFLYLLYRYHGLYSYHPKLVDMCVDDFLAYNNWTICVVGISPRSFPISMKIECISLALKTCAAPIFCKTCCNPTTLTVALLSFDAAAAETMSFLKRVGISWV